MYDPYADFVSTKLSNGLSVHVLYVPGVPFVHAQVAYRSGMVDDPEEKAGVAHFLEHMICANSGMTLPEMTDFFGADGGDIVANTNYYRTNYGFKSLTDSGRFAQYLDFWARATLNTPLSDHFEREQEVIRKEINRKAPNHMILEHRERVHRMAFRGLSEGKSRSSLGTRESFDRITLDDLNMQRNDRYVPQNAHFVCVGGMPLEEVVKYLEESWLGESMKGEDILPFTPLLVLPPRTSEYHEADLSAGNSLGSCTINKMWLVPGNVSFELLNIASVMLTRELKGELREKHGLVYATSATCVDLPTFSIFSLSASDFLKVEKDRVSELLCRVLGKFASDKSVFEVVKERRRAQVLSADQNLSAIMRSATDALVENGMIWTRHSQLEEIAAVQFSDLSVLRDALRESESFTVTEHK